MKYLVVITPNPTMAGFSAHVPDLPGCAATGFSEREAQKEIREAIRFHVAELKDDGLPVPAPSSTAVFVDA